MAALILHFDDEAAAAERLAAATGLASACIERHRFPDTELRLRLPSALPPTVVLLRSLANPNEKLVELLLTARTARQLGARRLALVCPYLAYMRQDIAFHPGEVVSQQVIGHFLAGLFDDVITVDPHLHRIDTLEAAIPVAHAVALSGAPLLGALIAAHHDDPLLVGPDAESAQWVAQAAASHGWAYGVCHKRRSGDREVAVELPAGLDPRGRAVVLVDDVASSGHTLARAAEALIARGAASVDVAVTHALFADDAIDVVTAAGVGKVWSTDSVPHASNAVSVAPAVAGAMREIGLA
ncbi:ribose-phosphate diphosphokinase [Nitrogeniibacter mangrovi]|uniref:Ribose-phosphate diphosphokinase n=1 Tax=Nitrogeniibacter mangrovi TaxID=2016596 RepID=A0A6C1B613_9RHOO|nr:ribose-phosphate diphosphokinase [Nitrogeniibacter mangrovi]QID19131.1 ribose-phosphate diphosphokinase [Nitrogeniibacter mangrovi]